MKQRNNFSWNSMYIVVEELGKGGNANDWFSIRIQKVANPSQIFTREDVELAITRTKICISVLTICIVSILS